MTTPQDAPRRSDRQPYSRLHHRARSHESAHASAVAPGDIPDRPLVCKDSAELIGAPDGLDELIGNLRADGSFSYDSEFIGELTYHPKLCVIQVASAKRVALIDPLADLDLSPFWELLADPSVEKIVHAGQQDIEPVMRHLGKPCANVFDTQIAAGLAALPYPVALSKLVFEFAGVRLGKGLTFTHWDARPLSAMQLRYAADDVRYLPLVRDVIGKRLQLLDHVEWAREECEAQCDPALYGFNAETQFLRVKGAASLEPRNQAVLRALVAWRDAAAREADVPPRSFLRDEIMLDMGRSPIKSIDRLSRVRGLPRPIESTHGGRIVDVTQTALALPASDLPVAREVEALPTEKFRGDALWAAAQSVCAGQGIDPALIASRQDLTDFWNGLRSGTFSPDDRLMKGWRREALGQPLVDLYEGKRQFAMKWMDGLLRTNSAS